MRGGSVPASSPKDDIILELRESKFYYNPKNKAGEIRHLTEPWWKISPEAPFNEETGTINCFMTAKWLIDVLKRNDIPLNHDNTIDIKLSDLYIEPLNDAVFKKVTNKSLKTLLKKYQST